MFYSSAIFLKRKAGLAQVGPSPEMSKAFPKPHHWPKCHPPNIPALQLCQSMLCSAHLTRNTGASNLEPRAIPCPCRLYFPLLQSLSCVQNPSSGSCLEKAGDHLSASHPAVLVPLSLLPQQAVFVLGETLFGCSQSCVHTPLPNKGSPD